MSSNEQQLQRSRADRQGEAPLAPAAVLRTPPPALFTPDDHLALFRVAERAIAERLATGKDLEIDVEVYSESLRQERATFVTLRIAGKLRGCMGTLFAKDPLVCDVAHNAVSAAFRDPRFPPLAADEFPQLEFHLSILTVPEPMPAASEAEFLERVRTGIDGLILYECDRRATLLPAVWANVRDPREFLAHLKRKAGLPVDYWSPSIRFERYTALSLERPGH